LGKNKRIHMIDCMKGKSANTPNFEQLRKEFPLLAHKTYLNSGSYCALANAVRSAIEAYMEDRLLLGANWDAWVEKNEAVRNLMAPVPMKSR